MVGRRKSGHHLPARVYEKHGALFFVDMTARWHRLGDADDLPGCLAAHAALLKAGGPVRTVGDLWEKFEREGMPDVAARTRRGRQLEMARVLRVFGQVDPRDIRPAHIWEFFERAGRGESARHTVRTFSAVLSAGVRWGALDRNPCFGLRLPGGAPRTRYVTDDEYLLVRGLAPEMIGLAMDLALLTGARQGDVLKLERSSVTDAGLQFRASKTGKAQVIGWNEELRLTVAACQRLQPRVRRTLLCSRSGKPYTSSGFQTAWQRLMERAEAAGLAERFTFHDLRAKSLSDAGSTAEAAARGGHADPRITERVYRRLPRAAKALSILDKPSIV